MLYRPPLFGSEQSDRFGCASFHSRYNLAAENARTLGGFLSSTPLRTIDRSRIVVRGDDSVDCFGIIALDVACYLDERRRLLLFHPNDN
jgi:hypothetical protein